MTSKRRRRAARRRSEATKTAAHTGDGAESPESKAEERSRPRPGPARSPFPPLPLSVSRGMWAVGATPLTLAWTFLSLLAAWALFVALGVEATPRFLTVVMAISPAHLFTDVPVGFGAGTGLAVFVTVAAMGLLRALTFGLLTLLILGWLEEGRADLRTALRRLPRSATVLFAVYLVEVGVIFVLLQLAAGFLGPLSLLVVVAALYFLVFVPVVAVVENASVRESFRRGFRAARLPGTRHLTLVMVYFLLLFYAASVSPFGIVSPATPDVATWGFAMIVTFVHAGVLGAVVYRWLAVRDEVPAGVPSADRSR